MLPFDFSGGGFLILWSMIGKLKKDLHKKADRKKAELLQGFFKTGKGEYAEGDLFLGVTVPDQRKIVLKYKNLGFEDLQKILKSKFHEERLVGFLILVEKFKKADERGRKEIFNFYIKNRKYANNWDFVDLTAPKIVGVFLENKNKKLLYRFARSKNVWERRIAMLSCFHYIYNKDCRDALKIAKILKNDRHDLIQKAVGWQLREVGKRCSLKDEEKFLRKYYKTMPRTMLRYAIERFPEEKRKRYLRK